MFYKNLHPSNYILYICKIMTVVDIIITVLLILALFKGLKDGLVKQIGGIIGIVLGIILAGRFSSIVSTWLHQWINASESAVKAISFALIIIAVCICVNLIGKVLEKIFSIAMLGWINRLLGAVLSVVGTILLIGALLSMIEYVNQTWFILIPEETMNESQTIGIIKDISQSIFPYLNKLFSSSITA